MTEQPFEQYGLAAWKQAMQDLRAAERQLEAARSANWSQVAPLQAHVRGLRTRADLLLADAVQARFMASA